MGVVVRKGTVPKPTPMPDFIRYKNYRIYPNADNTCFTVYHESYIGTGAANYIADSRAAAFAYIDSNPVVLKPHKPNEELECETHDCAFNSSGICKRKEIKGEGPIITEKDGCINGVIDIGL